jgi:hypothetical protein
MILKNVEVKPLEGFFYEWKEKFTFSIADVKVCFYLFKSKGQVAF